jgi:hypothetical protein
VLAAGDASASERDVADSRRNHRTDHLVRMALRGSPFDARLCLPGVVRTELGRNFFIPPAMCEAAGSVDCKGQLPAPVMAASAITLPLMIYGTKSVPQGAMTQVQCAADPALKGKLGGNFFSDCAETGTSGPGKDMAAAARLWKVSEELTGRPFSI